MLDTHTAMIDWGDGSAPEAVAVSQGAGSGSLTATHVYGDNGAYTVTVTVICRRGVSASRWSAPRT